MSYYIIPQMTWEGLSVQIPTQKLNIESPPLAVHFCTSWGKHSKVLYELHPRGRREVCSVSMWRQTSQPQCMGHSLEEEQRNI